MTNLSILLTDRTERFETFVSLFRYEFITYGTISLLLTIGLLSYLIRLVTVKTCATPKLSIT
jgi:hypothetical protein